MIRIIEGADDLELIFVSGEYYMYASLLATMIAELIMKSKREREIEREKEQEHKQEEASTCNSDTIL